MRYLNVSKTGLAVVVALTAFLATSNTWATPLTVTKTWNPGETLTAVDLNQSFDETEAAVTDNSSRIDEIQSQTVGMDFASSTATFELTEDNSIIQSVTISAPGPGYVIVSFSAFYTMIHVNGTQDRIAVGLSQLTNATIASLPSRRFLFLDAAFPSGEFSGSVASHAVFLVETAGTYTYYALGTSNKLTPNPGFVVRYPATQAVFHPNRY